MELYKSASALGLYKYNCAQAGSGIFGRFYSTVLNQFTSCGITPVYVGAEGEGYSGKLTKMGSLTHDKLVKTNFADVTVLSVVANPVGSNEPSYDNFASASLSYVEVNRELLACIVINESFIRIYSKEYDALMLSQVDLCSWDFGYGFSSSAEKQPDFHILGLDNGKLSPAEYRLLIAWYDAPGDVRTVLLRDVYPYNLLNDFQLEAQVGGGITLRQFIQRQPGCSLTRASDSSLYLWKVPEAEIQRLKQILVGSSVLIS